jgi:hypothetical protein
MVVLVVVDPVSRRAFFREAEEGVVVVRCLEEYVEALFLTTEPGLDWTLRLLPGGDFSMAALYGNLAKMLPRVGLVIRSADNDDAMVRSVRFVGMWHKEQGRQRNEADDRQSL